MPRWALCVLATLACVTVHESGHAIAVLLCGGDVQEFAIIAWPPHMTPAGSFTQPQLCLISLAGTGLFFTLWFPWMLFRAEGERGVVTAVASICAAQEAIVWVLGAMLAPAAFAQTDAAHLVTESKLPGTLIGMATLGLAWLVWNVARRVHPHNLGADTMLYCLIWNLIVWR